MTDGHRQVSSPKKLSETFGSLTKPEKAGGILASENRTEMVLENAIFKLASVVSKIDGVSSMNMTEIR
jgi:hypothetical protein